MTLILSGTDGLSDIDGSAATPAVRGTDANTGIFFPAADTIGFAEGGAEVMRLDSSGKVLVGTANTPSNRDTVTPKLIVNGAGVAGSMQVVRNTTPGGGGAILELTSTRGTDVNSYTILQSGDGVGSIVFGGADGTQFTPAATIFAGVDGTPGANDMPGRLIFSTTADGAATVTERMRIDSSGNVGIGTASPNAKLNVVASSGSTGFRMDGGLAAFYPSYATANQGLQVDTTNLASGSNALFVNAPTGWTGNFISGNLNGVQQFRIDQAGNLAFNSGYGSSAAAFGCRAWVNFNGQSSAAIRGSGNISSITINGTGDWTLNFATAMPDANYAAVFGSDAIGNNDARGALVEKSNDGTSYHLAGSLRIIYGYTFTSGTTADGSFMSNVAIFR